MILRRTSTIFLSALWLANLWRAATQSIVHDEALTWQMYLAGPVSDIFETFSANNHFLVVVLMRALTGLFGYSELSMRLVALAGGTLFYYAAWRLCLRSFGDRWIALLALALLTMNPLVQDFMVAARGYGPALALFVAGLWLALEALETTKPSPKRVFVAGLCLGSSVAANLVFVLPVLALGAVCTWLTRQRGLPAWHLPLGIIVCGFLLFVLSPVGKANSEDFYAGTSSVAESVDNLARCSLAHNDGLGGLNRDNPVQSIWRRLIAWVVAPLVIALGLWLGRGAKSGPSLLAGLVAVCTCAPLTIWLLAHAAWGSPLPTDRTGILALAFVGLLATAVIASLWDRGRLSRLAALVLLLVGICVAVQYGLQFQTRFFLVWRYDADTRSLLETAAKTASPPVSLAASWQLEPAANFYRITRNWQWLRPVSRQSLSVGGDVFLLREEDSQLIKQQGLRIVARGPVSGAYLCTR